MSYATGSGYGCGSLSRRIAAAEAVRLMGKTWWDSVGRITVGPSFFSTRPSYALCRAPETDIQRLLDAAARTPCACYAVSDPRPLPGYGGRQSTRADLDDAMVEVDAAIETSRGTWEMNEVFAPMPFDAAGTDIAAAPATRPMRTTVARRPSTLRYSPDGRGTRGTSRAASGRAGRASTGGAYALVPSYQQTPTFSGGMSRTVQAPYYGNQGGWSAPTYQLGALDETEEEIDQKLDSGKAPTSPQPGGWPAPSSYRPGNWEFDTCVYNIAQGDTLAGLAETYLGTPDRLMEIWNAQPQEVRWNYSMDTGKHKTTGAPLKKLVMPKEACDRAKAWLHSDKPAAASTVGKKSPGKPVPGEDPTAPTAPGGKAAAASSALAKYGLLAAGGVAVLGIGYWALK